MRSTSQRASQRRRIMGMENGDSFSRIRHNLKLIDAYICELVERSELEEPDYNGIGDQLRDVSGCLNVIAGDLDNSIYVAPDEFIEDVLIPWFKNHGFGLNQQ